MRDIVEEAGKCNDKLSPVILDLSSERDVRAVIAALLSQATLLSQNAIAALGDRKFIDEMWEGGFKGTLVPAKTEPRVLYRNDDETFGRKQ